MSNPAIRAAFLAFLLVGVLFAAAPPTPRKTPTRQELLHQAITDLVSMQEKDGSWPYEGVYRVNRQLPIGYRVGGTAIVASTLLHAAPDDKDAKKAVSRGLAFVLKNLADPDMAASTQNRYDVRVWGQAYALEFLCHVQRTKAADGQEKEVARWLTKLVAILVEEEIDGGGWNYANHRRPASFVTAPVAQALLYARAQGEKVPDEVLTRAKKSLESARTEQGAFTYSGTASKKVVAGDRPAGSAARSAACESTLVLLGGGSTDRVREAITAFHEHWDELNKRRAQKGTHEGPYRIAPYYFYYGHRHAAQAIELLPEKERAAAREKLLTTLLKTRDEKGTWNDRVFERSRNYGTAMATLVLLADRAPLPPRLK